MPSCRDALLDNVTVNKVHIIHYQKASSNKVFKCEYECVKYN